MKKKLILILFVFSSLFVLVGCGSTQKLKYGDAACIIYTGTFTDGTLFEANSPENIMCFVIGSGKMVRGLEEGVIGMKIGGNKKIKISPEKGFADQYSKNNIQKISKIIFDKLKIDLKNGKMQKLGNIEGIIKGTEKDENGDEVILFDVNPRQTWDNLQYNVLLIDMSKDKASFLADRYGKKPWNLDK